MGIVMVFSASDQAPMPPCIAHPSDMSLVYSALYSLSQAPWDLPAFPKTCEPGEVSYSRWRMSLAGSHGFR
jgi:hypothetical protein